MNAKYNRRHLVHQVKALVRRTPFIGALAAALRRRLVPPGQFRGSGLYWEDRYARGGDSGAGSYSRLACFKADIINDFVLRNRVETVIEFGSGDGNQLKMTRYQNYLGFDVSRTAIELCRSIFRDDASKAFKLMNEYLGEHADLTLSLDVIYHLVEDRVFDSYMRRLFDAADRFVIVYSSNDAGLNERYGAGHVRHRTFTEWISEHAAGWRLQRHISNKYPYQDADPDETSFADFYIYEKVA